VVPNKEHHVKLTPDERGTPQAIGRKENAGAIKVQKAGALPLVDPGGYGFARYWSGSLEKFGET